MHFYELLRRQAECLIRSILRLRFWNAKTLQPFCQAVALATADLDARQKQLIGCRDHSRDSQLAVDQRFDRWPSCVS